jgi:hypothetical protein
MWNVSKYYGIKEKFAVDTNKITFLDRAKAELMSARNNFQLSPDDELVRYIIAEACHRCAEGAVKHIIQIEGVTPTGNHPREWIPVLCNAEAHFIATDLWTYKLAYIESEPFNEVSIEDVLKTCKRLVELAETLEMTQDPENKMSGADRLACLLRNNGFTSHTREQYAEMIIGSISPDTRDLYSSSTYDAAVEHFFTWCRGQMTLDYVTS